MLEGKLFARKSNVLFAFLFINLLLVGFMLLHSNIRQSSDIPRLHERREIVRVLGLSDLCLFTEARYTRHPSMADLNTPFQDFPMSLEHFPSGSLMPVPPHLRPQTQR
jgi:hypothetical protein